MLTATSDLCEEAQLAVFLLASYGATNIITASQLLAGARTRLQRRSRWLGAWARCAMCMSVPVGVGWNLVGLRLGPDLPRFVEFFAAGAVSSGGCWIVRVVLARLGEDAL